MDRWTEGWMDGWMDVDTHKRKTLEQMSATAGQYANRQKGAEVLLDKRYLVKYLDLVYI